MSAGMLPSEWISEFLTDSQAKMHVPHLEMLLTDSEWETFSV